MKPSKRISKRLQGRVAGYTAIGTSQMETKVEQRWSSGGYTQPGSRKWKGK